MQEIQLLQLQHSNELQQLQASHEAAICCLRRDFDLELLQQQRSAAAEAAAAAAKSEETLKAAADSFAAKLKQAEAKLQERLQEAQQQAAADREALIQT